MEPLALIDVMFFWTQYAWPILMFILGLGLVVFVHELGHFIVAKWVGIKVERFAFGFGRRLFGMHVGETDYCVNAIPLGGYVKMLGQEDFKPLEENDKPDPRAFDQKSVGARFAVISAGVVMNVILAAVLFIIVGMVGKKFPAPVVGGVAPDTAAASAVIEWQGAPKPLSPDPLAMLAATPATAPAHTAPASLPTSAAATTSQAATLAASAPADNAWSDHLRTGDRILKIEMLNGSNLLLSLIDNKVTHLQDIAMTAALASPDDRYAITIERVADGMKRIGVLKLGVRSDPSGMFRFGFASSFEPVVDVDKAQWNIAPFQDGDRILAVNGHKVYSMGDLEDLGRFTADAVPVVVERGGKPVTLMVQPKLAHAPDVLYRKDGSAIRGTFAGAVDDKSFKFRLADGKVETLAKADLLEENLILLGMIPRMTVSAVIPEAGVRPPDLKPGDIIVGYGDTETPTYRQLQEINNSRVKEKVAMEVLRNGSHVQLTVTPRMVNGEPKIGFARGSDLANPVVAAVLPGSPAAKAGIESGARILTVNGNKVESWGDLYEQLLASAGKPAVVTFRVRSAQKHATLPPLTPAVLNPQDFRFYALAGLPWQPMMTEVRKTNPLDAVAWGSRETVRMVLSSYVSLRSLIRGYASPKNMVGPIGMGAMSVQVVRESYIDFFYFLAFISAAIAVFNFLPLPVVDGGYAVFLLIEKIRGKPVPVKVQNVVQVIGLVLLAGLFLAVTANDLWRIITGGKY